MGTDKQQATKEEKWVLDLTRGDKSGAVELAPAAQLPLAVARPNTSAAFRNTAMVL